MTVIDLSDTIQAKSDQLNASEIAGEMTITVTKVTKIKSSDQPVSIYYEGGEKKPWKPCLSMRRVMAHLWGEKVDMTGRQITLICDPTVTWGGDEVGGIRIKALSHIDGEKKIPLRASKHKVKKYTVLPITAKQEPKINIDKVLEDADNAAAQGMGAYKAFFDGLNAAEKKVVSTTHDELKQKAKEADDGKESNDVPAWE